MNGLRTGAVVQRFEDERLDVPVGSHNTSAAGRGPVSQHY